MHDIPQHPVVNPPAVGMAAISLYFTQPSGTDQVACMVCFLYKLAHIRGYVVSVRVHFEDIGEVVLSCRLMCFLYTKLHIRASPRWSVRVLCCYTHFSLSSVCMFINCYQVTNETNAKHKFSLTLISERQRK